MNRNIPNIQIFVFSFNRGVFLENCLRSIIECAPSLKTTIIDDNSSDKYTNYIINNISPRFKVIRPPKITKGKAQLGGLYGNMNLAIDMAIEEKSRYALFIQDDMQFVRRILPSDISRIECFFQKRENAIQYQSCFRRRNWRKAYRESAELAEDVSTFFIPENLEKGSFSAVGVFNVHRVKSKLGNFANGEGVNGERCRDLGVRMGISSYPFMNWLPYPSSFRGGRRSFEHKFTEFLGGAGFHPIEYMSSDLETKFLGKDPKALPIAEDWLFAPKAPRHDVWSTGGGKMNVRARGGCRLILFEALGRLKKATYG